MLRLVSTKQRVYSLGTGAPKGYIAILIPFDRRTRRGNRGQVLLVRKGRVFNDEA